ncbi:MAG: 2-amino-4-hydroxy-6-hydroxymethyldihydropteridine diphosphokinase [Nitrospirales bacterium]|nr:2-amino-4-hydroxy-6-hydroxymethyldihydropteridine diphosphokinase [Nitrospirales bacterium]
MSIETVFIGFGSNQGDRHDYCDRALTLMNLLPHSQLTRISSYYETEPIDPHGTMGTTWFYNGVVQIETNIAPHSLLEILQETERGLGRHDDGRNGPRTMDFDILLYGQHTMAEPGLTIPHPRLHLRRFVLAPLAELAPAWVHPILKKSITELLNNVDDLAQVQKLKLIPGSRYGHYPTCARSLS